MDPDDAQREELARRVDVEQGRRFPTRKAAYQAAGVNPETWARILRGERVRHDRLRAVVSTLWPSSNGDWAVVLADATPEGGSAALLDRSVLERVSDRDLLEELNRRLLARSVTGGAAIDSGLAEHVIGQLPPEVQSQVRTGQEIVKPRSRKRQG